MTLYRRLLLLLLILLRLLLRMLLLLLMLMELLLKLKLELLLLLLLLHLQPLIVRISSIVAKEVRLVSVLIAKGEIQQLIALVLILYGCLYGFAGISMRPKIVVQDIVDRGREEGVGHVNGAAQGWVTKLCRLKATLCEVGIE